jgi:Putative Ig domain
MITLRNAIVFCVVLTFPFLSCYSKSLSHVPESTTARAATSHPLLITSSVLPSGVLGNSYAASMAATGGTPPYAWGIASGSLPAGISFSENGVFSGIPTVQGNYKFTVKVADTATPAQVKEVSASIVTTNHPLLITSSVLPAGVVGTAYAANMSATGGTPPYVWTIASGSIPPGVAFSETGAFSGTPQSSGRYTFVVKVFDRSTPAKSKTVTATIVVTTKNPLVITSSVLPSGVDKATYSASLMASGGTAPYTWSITSGSLPSGLSLTAAGAISGTPTVIGTYGFSVKVTDSSSPIQGAAATTTIIVTVPPLTITSPALISGVSGTGYSASLTANGGTSPYTWSVTSGSLPAGLTLSALGVISGTPTTSGTSVFTTKVTDSSSPALAASAAATIIVAVQPLTITSSALVSGVSGTGYSANLTANGGTLPYKWSIASGSLPAGLSLTAAGLISGIPTVSGSSTFATAVTDSSSPALVQSATTSILVGPAPPPTGGTTWYVRPDGGTRFSTDLPTGQCNGKYDASYASTGGTGVNQNCAFNDFRFLYDSQGYNDNAWVIAGGDTVIVRGCVSGPNNVAPNCRIGWDINTPNSWCIGTGNGGCQPPIPAGTASQHTRILGQNYAACVVPTPTTTGNTSQLFGGFGLYETLNLKGAQYLDVECLELTSHVNCIEFGYPTAPVSLPGCNRNPGASLSDYVDYGLTTSNTSHDILLQDLWIHGMSNSGIRGPIGGTVSATRVNIGYNGDAGWSMDDGYSTQNVNGVLNLNYVTIEWNGCTQQYPIVNAIPALYCFDDATGGYGDGFGTQSPAVLQFTCNHCVGRYNTQDAFDVGHVSNSAVSWTDSFAYGNEGGMFKSGNNSSYTLINDVVIGNCYRMTQPFPGAPSSYNLYLGDACRAAGDQNSFGFDSTQTPLPSATIEFSTFIGYGATFIDTQYAGVETSCPGCSFLFRDNIVLGYSETSYNDGQAPGMWNSISPTTQDHNLFYGLRNCPAVSGDISSNCQLDAGFVGEPASPLSAESQMDNYNFALAPGSSAIGAGVSIVGVTTDYDGNARATPPSVGALEEGSTTPTIQ